MKYIDADKLKAEIERQEKQCPLDTYEGRHRLFILGGLKTSLSTLEEPVSEDLEEAAMNYIAPIENEDGLKVINFSGQDIKDAFKTGAEWQKEQMMKDAEECELYWDGDFLAIDLNMAALGYSERDKVKIIIVKEDKQ